MCATLMLYKCYIAAIIRRATDTAAVIVGSQRLATHVGSQRWL